MPHIHPNVAESDLSRFLAGRGLVRTHQGKVRDTYDLLNGLLLVVVTDRISIFDYVLNALVMMKGIVLNRLSVFWFTKRLKGIKHHLVAWGSDIDQYLPVHLSGNRELWKRAQIVKKLQPIPAECIVRGHITGTGYKDYKKTGMICGILLPEGLRDGDQLPQPLFTPSTKAKKGHDQNVSETELSEIIASEMKISLAKAQRLVRTLKRYSLEIYRQGYEYAKSKGIILADTKLEFGLDENGDVVLMDEVLTPDSSRNWLVHDWCVAPYQTDKAPTGFDKQPVRDAGTRAALPNGEVIDISTFKDPDDATQIRVVQSWVVPESELVATTDRYLQLEIMLESEKAA
ncbi:MAG: phosphoribosylaminoimidazolesuccinocarboxamide synthase [Candidatus Doudnabacteria bacterium]|nr:phosphoribosylaminoimidazolesuccinocarboxamide synthase [Candidatus Doudnabacteria bacterium]